MIGRHTILGLALAAGFLAGCGEETGNPKAEAKEPKPPVVRVAIAKPAGASTDRYTGEVRSRIESDLGFRVAGKIVERSVDMGDRVSAGDLLMRLDDADYELRHEAAQAQANAAERQVAAAQAEVNRTAADEKRYGALVGNKTISRQTYDQAKSAYDRAVAQLEAARAQLIAARADVRQSANQLAYTKLRADVDGVVLAVRAEPGQVVQAGTPVVSIARAGAREAVVAIPETRLASVPEVAEAHLFKDPDTAFPARLRELSANADPLTRTFTARYTLSGAGADAALGSTVTIEASGANAKGLVLPIGALFDDGRGAGVWIIDPETNSVTFRSVEVADLGDEEVLVVGGLEPGERVVALGAHLLHEGEKVRPQEGML